jgi:hypothetical protein
MSLNVLGFGFLRMAVDAFPPVEGSRRSSPRHLARAGTSHPPSFFLRPLSALFRAIDSQCRVQGMDSPPDAQEADEVIYYVNRDSSG